MIDPDHRLERRAAYDQSVEILDSFASILPHDAGAAVTRIEDAGRLAERRAGHVSAREAALRAGATSPPRFDSPDGPIWPDGFAGSVSHTRAFAIAAVSKCRSLGVDIERIISYARAERVAGWIATSRERHACGGLPERLTLLFSIKESLFKCLHPLVKTWFDFQDAEIETWEPDGVSIVLLRDLMPFPRGTEFRARFRFTHDNVLTTVAL